MKIRKDQFTQHWLQKELRQLQRFQDKLSCNAGVHKNTSQEIKKTSKTLRWK